MELAEFDDLHVETRQSRGAEAALKPPLGEWFRPAARNSDFGLEPDRNRRQLGRVGLSLLSTTLCSLTRLALLRLALAVDTPLILLCKSSLPAARSHVKQQRVPPSVTHPKGSGRQSSGWT